MWTEGAWWMIGVSAIPTIVVIFVSVLLARAVQRNKSLVAQEVALQNQTAELRSLIREMLERDDERVATITELQEAKAKSERLLMVHIAQNEAFEQQRNTAWELYRAAGSKASAAQTMMLREINRLVLMLNKYRSEKGEQDLSIAPGLVKAVETFKEEHAS